MVGRRERRQRFPPVPSSVGEARRLIRECLLAEGRGDLLDTAELLVSEIVTNALVHAGTPIDVSFTFLRGGLRVEVSDGSPHMPSAREHADDSWTGRGLRLLEELVDEWGVIPVESGKTVWFQIASSSSGRGRPQAGTSSQSGLETLHVRLLNVPLLLHEAWREHSETLLREYLLATLDDDAPPDPFTAHAEASDAIALLAEHIPPAGVPEDPHELIANATEPSITSREVVLPVPWTASFPAPEQIDHPRATGHPAATRSSRALVAADERDRIVAVSAPAARLLGYADQDELVGARVLTIVPERYRQAHLAGFTLHFLTGRALLLDRAVVVPVQRRDGREVEVEMTILKERTPTGAVLFVAELDGPV